MIYLIIDRLSILFNEINILFVLYFLYILLFIGSKIKVCRKQLEKFITPKFMKNWKTGCVIYLSYNLCTQWSLKPTFIKVKNRCKKKKTFELLIIYDFTYILLDDYWNMDWGISNRSITYILLHYFRNWGIGNRPIPMIPFTDHIK